MCKRNHGTRGFILATAILAIGWTFEARSQASAEDIIVVAEGNRPQPDRLPAIRVVREKLWDQYYPMVEATFPNAPDFTCSSWCYEAEVDFVDAKAVKGGAVEMRHRDQHNPQMLVITTMTPSSNAVVFEARIVLDKENHPGAVLPSAPPGLNLCWQLRHAPAFASKPDKYPAFVERCFIFTEEGQTFLLDTERVKIPVQPVDHEYNNPPWVQSYSSVKIPVPETASTVWAGNSPSCFVTPVIGAVSRDKKYIAAIANNTADYVCQAWHDCMHNNPKWMPEDGPIEDRRWRVGVYVMENDAKALLERVARDFPEKK